MTQCRRFLTVRWFSPGVFELAEIIDLLRCAEASLPLFLYQADYNSWGSRASTDGIMEHVGETAAPLHEPLGDEPSIWRIGRYRKLCLHSYVVQSIRRLLIRRDLWYVHDV